MRPTTRTRLNSTITATSLATVTDSSARANGPRASCSSIIAIVSVGEDAAAKVPSASATGMASRNGWCTVMGNHGLTLRVTSVTRTNGTTMEPAVARSSGTASRRRVSSRSSVPTVNAISAAAASAMNPSERTSSARTSPSHGGPTQNPASRYAVTRGSRARAARPPARCATSTRKPSASVARASSRPPAVSRWTRAMIRPSATKLLTQRMGQESRCAKGF